MTPVRLKQDTLDLLQVSASCAVTDGLEKDTRSSAVSGHGGTTASAASFPTKSATAEHCAAPRSPLDLAFAGKRGTLGL